MPASIVWASMRQNRNTETASSGVTVFSTAIFTIPAPRRTNEATVQATAAASARLLFPCPISGYTHRQQMASRTSGARVSAVCASASETILR